MPVPTPPAADANLSRVLKLEPVQFVGRSIFEQQLMHGVDFHNRDTVPRTILSMSAGPSSFCADMRRLYPDGYVKVTAADPMYVREPSTLMSIADWNLYKFFERLYPGERYETPTGERPAWLRDDMTEALNTTAKLRQERDTGRAAFIEDYRDDFREAWSAEITGQPYERRYVAASLPGCGPLQGRRFEYIDVSNFLMAYANNEAGRDLAFHVASIRTLAGLLDPRGGKLSIFPFLSEPITGKPSDVDGADLLKALQGTTIDGRELVSKVVPVEYRFVKGWTHRVEFTLES